MAHGGTEAVRVQGLSKRFVGRGGHVGRMALSNIDLSVAPGEMVALIGASGSGKSTLLRHLAGLVAGDTRVAVATGVARATGTADEAGTTDATGVVEVAGSRIQQDGRISREIRAARARIGFVFQQFNLVARLSVLVNVMVGRLHFMPRWRGLLGLFRAEDRAIAFEALRRVGIAECHAQRASTLSGGQQQRAAIARALVQEANVLLADEPIASLDPESSRKVMEILARINREDGCTVIVSLHQVEIALRYCPRVIALNQGRIVYDGPARELTPALLDDLYGVHADGLRAVSDCSQPTSAEPPAPRHSLSPALQAQAA